MSQLVEKAVLFPNQDGRLQLFINPWKEIQLLQTAEMMIKTEQRQVHKVLDKTHFHVRKCCYFRYDPKTDTWTTVSSLSVPKDAVGVCLLGDRLYAVGGYDGQSYLNTVESYDAQNNEWTEVNTSNQTHKMNLTAFLTDKQSQLKTQLSSPSYLLEGEEINPFSEALDNKRHGNPLCFFCRRSISTLAGLVPVWWWWNCLERFVSRPQSREQLWEHQRQPRLDKQNNRSRTHPLRHPFLPFTAFQMFQRKTDSLAHH